MNDIRMMSVNDIIPYENNPRDNEDAVDKVAASLREFGFKQPIVVDKDNIVIVGHTRLKAAKKLNMSEVPVLVADDLTDEQVKGYRLADNKTAEFAEWDAELLNFELDGIIDIDMSDFGFDVDNISPDDFGDDFTLPDGEKSEICQITFTLHEKQKELVEYAISLVKDNVTETFGNTNSNGNGLYEVVKQWADARK